MHKTAVGYAIGKLLQVMGMLLIIPLSLAIYDNPQVSFSGMFAHTEIFGFGFAILFALLVGTLLVYLYNSGKNLQGVKEGYAIVTFGWLGLTFVGSIPMMFWFISTDPYGWSNLFLHLIN